MKGSRMINPMVYRFLILCLALSACGANARTKGLQTGLVVLNASRDTVLQVSRTREKQIVEDCLAKTPQCTKAEVRSQVDDWRSKVDPVFAALDKAYRVLSSAGLLSDMKSASEALAAIAEAVKLSKELKP